MSTANINIPTTAPPPAPPNTTGDKPVSPENKEKRGKIKKDKYQRVKGKRKKIMEWKIQSKNVEKAYGMKNSIKAINTC